MRYASINTLAQQETPYSMQAICQAHGVSRQAFYQYQKRLATQQLQEDIVLQLVQQIRARQPRIGTRKLHALLAPQLEKLDCQLGRDALFELLRKHHLLIRPKRKYVHTTNANHPFRRYDNLIVGLPIQRIHQVFVADITYLDTLEGFVYLALLTDVYSRKIVGFDVSDSLSVEGALRALNSALRQRPKATRGNPDYPLIHHSDRGVQYACYAYTDLLREHSVAISMAATGDVYENALAERVNGILKLDFLLDQQFGSLAEAQACAWESIGIYNQERPHLSLAMRTPEQMYQESYDQWYSS